VQFPREPERQTRAFILAVKLTFLVAAPVCLGIAALAPDIVALLPPRWAHLAPVLRVLAIGTLAEPLASYSQMHLIALGRGKALLWVGVGSLIVGWSGTAAGVASGYVGGLAVAWAVWNAAQAALPLALASRWLHLGWPFWRELVKPLLCAGAMAGLAAAAAACCRAHAPGLALWIGVATGVACYGLSLVTLMRREFSQSIQLVRDAIRRRAALKGP
jgi:O-antigen/teichoic acid export membrane protein